MKMNRFKLFWILVAALFAGCDNEDFDPDYYAPSINAHYLAVSQDDFLFGTAVSRSENFTVYSESTPWEFTSSLTWISLSPL